MQMKGLYVGLLMIALASSAFGAESLEELLARGMQNHPDIAAAGAKVALAEAELNVARMEVAREIIALHGEREALARDVTLLQELFEEGALADRAELTTAASKLAQVEAQLKQVVDPQKLHNAAAKVLGGRHLFLPRPAWKPADADKFAEALTKTVTIDYRETPIAAVVDHLQELAGVKIVDDRSVEDIPVTVTLKQVPLGAGLQAIEDSSRDSIRFVVREYGIRAISADRVAEENLFAVDLWRAAVNEKKKPMEEPNAATSN